MRGLQNYIRSKNLTSSQVTAYATCLFDNGFYRHHGGSFANKRYPYAGFVYDFSKYGSVADLQKDIDLDLHNAQTGNEDCYPLKPDFKLIEHNSIVSPCALSVEDGVEYVVDLVPIEMEEGELKWLITVDGKFVEMQIMQSLRSSQFLKNMRTHYPLFHFTGAQVYVYQQGKDLKNLVALIHDDQGGLQKVTIEMAFHDIPAICSAAQTATAAEMQEIRIFTSA